MKLTSRMKMKYIVVIKLCANNVKLQFEITKTLNAALNLFKKERKQQVSPSSLFFESVPKMSGSGRSLQKSPPMSRGSLTCRSQEDD